MGNHNSGRRPKPTALHILNGNPSRKNLNINEVRPPAGDITQPTGLSAGASVVWAELAPVCLAMGTLTTADLRPFATLCELQSTLQQTSASKDGRALFTLKAQDEAGSTVKIVINAVLKLERETANALRPYYEYFGLTPSSRARLATPKGKATEAPVSKWAGALK